jgi:dolichol-phosphate mannosyltransferase
MNKTVILLPTYNERQNVGLIVPEIFQVEPEVYVLVIDDSSPDGTADTVRSMMNIYPNLAQGLGEAYKAGMLQVLADTTVERIIIMDADGSHAAAYLPDMLLASQNYDLVIGSRYVNGGGIENWAKWRYALSQWGNFYARSIVGLSVKDLTAGFVCFNAHVLRNVDFSKVHASGYAFQIELKFYTVYTLGCSVKEIPIMFKARREGESKISLHIIREGLKTPWRLFYRRWINDPIAATIVPDHG